MYQSTNKAIKTHRYPSAVDKKQTHQSRVIY